MVLTSALEPRPVALSAPCPGRSGWHSDQGSPFLEDNRRAARSGELRLFTHLRLSVDKCLPEPGTTPRAGSSY
jgi:hypothetical protein